MQDSQNIIEIGGKKYKRELETDPNIIKQFRQPTPQPQQQQPQNNIIDIGGKKYKVERETDPDIIHSMTHKSNALGSFLKGFTRNFEEYASSINKGLDKGLDYLAGRDTKFFEDNVDFWNKKKLQNSLETSEHPYWNMAGQMILDPVNLAPAGVFTKGSKVARMTKSALGGAGVGYATTAFKTYGDNSKTDEEKFNENLIGAGFGATINAIIAGVTKGRIKNIIPEDMDEASQRKVADAILNNAEEVGLSKQEAVKAQQTIEDIKKKYWKEEVYPKKEDEYEPDFIMRPDEKTLPVVHDGEVDFGELLRQTDFNRLSQHPRFNELLNLRRDVLAKDAKSPQKLVQKRQVAHVDTPNENKTIFTPAEYTKNYDADFMLTKKDIAKIESGKIDDEVLEKLKADLDTMDNHPEWSVTEEELKAREAGKPMDMSLSDWNEASTLFSNFQHNLAGGMGGGTLNASSAILNPQSADENGDGVLSTDELASKFFNGFLAGAIGVGGLKMLAKKNPEIYAKVRQHMMDNYNPDGTPKVRDGGSVQLGVFAGRSAKGYDEAKQAGKVFDGKYDAMERFEIDDSASSAKNIARFIDRDTTLGKVFEHDKLFENYPDLKDTPVRIHRGNGTSFSKDGIEIGLKDFNSIDEIRSAILHETQHAIQNKEGFARGGSAQEFYNDFKDKIELLKYEIDTEPNELVRLNKMQRLQEIESSFANGAKEKAFDDYKRLAGEIEARDVQARADYTKRQREEIAPYSSENIPQDEAIVRFSNSGDEYKNYHAKELEDAYLNKKTDKVLENELLKEAKPLPKPISSYQDFKKNFNWSYESKYNFIDTPIGQVRANPNETFRHLFNNTHYQDRNYISGAFFETLKDPLFVVKKPYKNDWNTVFYKPFKDENGKYHLASFSVNNNGELVHKTFFEIDNLGKVKELIKVPDGNLLYYKGRNGLHSQGANSETPQLNELGKTDLNSESIAQNDNGVKLGAFGGDAPKARKAQQDANNDGFFQKVKEHANLTFEELVERENNKQFSDISQDNSHIQNISNSIKELFTDTFSKAYHDAREKVHIATQETITRLEKLQKVLGNLDEASDRELYRYMTKESDGALLDARLKKVADQLRKEIDDLGRKLVEHNILSEEAYKEWVGTYLHRQYESKLNPYTFIKKGMKIDRVFQRGLSTTTKDIKATKTWLEKNGVISKEELKDVKNFDDLQIELNRRGLLGKLSDGKVSLKELPNGKWEIRRDYTKAERQKMGEIESAKYAIPETLFKLNKMLSHAKFLKEIEKVDGVVLPIDKVKEFGEEAVKKAGYVKLNGAEFGALNGKYVRRDVASDIGYAYKNLANAHSSLEQTWNSYHTLWKKSKTVWNPTAHANNFIGNWFLMHLAGVPSYKIPSMVNDGLKQMKLFSRLEDLETKAMVDGLNSNELKELNKLRSETKIVQEAKKNGIFGRSQLNDILATGDQSLAKKGGMLHKLDKKAEAWYQAEDNINRLSFYISLRKAGKDPKKAKEMVDFMLPDYSKPLPKGWRFARDYGIAPFISWSYYTMPKIVKMMGTKQGAKQVAKVMALYSLIEFIGSGGELTPLDNLPFTDTNKPEDFKGRRMVVGKDGNNYHTWKVDRMIPYAEMQSPINFAKSQFSGVVPSLSTAILSGNKLYNGRPITYKNKSVSDKLIDYGKYGVNQYAPIPVPVTSGMNLIDSLTRSAKRRKRSRVVQERGVFQNIVKNLGINLVDYDVNQLRKQQRQ